MKILVVQTAFIGDVILATPLIEKLRRFYPEAKIDFLLRKGNEGLFDGHPHLRKVLVWNKKAGKLKHGFEILKAIRRERYDLVLNCQRFLSSGLFTVFSGAKSTVGFDKNPLSVFFSKKIKHKIGRTHEVERNLALIADLTDGTIERPKLHPAAPDFEKVKSLLIGKHEVRLSNQSYATIAPTSVWFTKQFPAEKWVELIQRLPADLRVFLLGGKGDFEACEKIKQASGRAGVENWAGQLSFLQSAALMSGAAMNYANDSAPIHMASAMNAPIVAVFCSTVPDFGFTPLSDRSFVAENREKLDCRPCGLHGFRACPKGHFRCAWGIEVTDVLSLGSLAQR